MIETVKTDRRPTISHTEVVRNMRKIKPLKTISPIASIPIKVLDPVVPRPFIEGWEQIDDS